MAVTTAVLSGTVDDLVGSLDPKYLARITLVIEANTTGSLLLDTSGNRHLAGAKRVPIDKTTGAYSVTLVRTNSADIVPAAGRLYRATLIYPSGTPGAGNVTQTSGWFALTADASLADVWTGIETLLVPASANLNDVAMANVDALAASTYRVQQDARLSATYVKGGAAATAPASPGVGVMWYDPADNPPPPAASDVTATTTGYANVSGTTVQAQLTSIDGKLTPTFIGARAYGLTSRLMGSGAWEPVYMTGETFDTHGYHDTATNPDRFTIPTGKGGKYRVLAVISYALNATGTRQVSFVKNGATRTSLIDTLSVGAGFRTRVMTSDVLDLAAGDYIRVEGFQDSGANLEVQDTTAGGVAGETFCAIEYLGA